MIRSLYHGATWLAAPLLRRHLARRVPRARKSPSALNERYGKASLARPAGRLGWLHGASVGETQSLLPLIDALTERAARSEPPGHQRHRDLGPPAGPAPAATTLHQYLPLDRQAWVARFLDHWRPDFALWVECEFWPNLLERGERAAFRWPGQWPALRLAPSPLGAGRLAHPAPGRGLSRRARPGCGPGARLAALGRETRNAWAI